MKLVFCANLVCMAGGIVAMGISGCGFLNVEDVKLGQLPMVTETGEWSSPVDTAGHFCNWMESKCLTNKHDLEMAQVIGQFTCLT